MGSRGYILIVDDEATVRLVFRRTLEAAGYEVAEAEDGERGLLRLQEFPADLILLDLQMPRLGGTEMLRRLRAADNQVPVVIITGHGQNPDALAAMKEGAIEVLPKPLTPGALSRAVAGVCGSPTKTWTLRSSAPPETSPEDSELARARHALSRGQIGEAERLLRQTLTPGTAEAHDLLGMVHECLREYNAAYHCYKAALEMDPRYRPALLNMWRYCEKFGLDFDNKSINPAARAHAEPNEAGPNNPAHLKGN